MRQDAIILNTIAKAMNAGGSAIVSVFDAGTAAFNCTMSALSPGERIKLVGRIKTCETKIRALHTEIAKESAKFSDPSAVLESEAVKAILATIKLLTAQIEYMKQRIAELDRIKAANKPQLESIGVGSFIAHSISGLLPGEKTNRQHKILANEKKMHELYCEFAKETAKQPDPHAAINSEVVVGIFEKIKELKAENESLKLGNTGVSEKKAEKPQSAETSKLAEKKPQPESSGVAKFFLHAISDSLSKYLPIQKPRSDESANVKESDAANAKEPASESVKVLVPESNEQADATSIGYDRTKSCHISTPAMHPPTLADIKNVTGVQQTDALQEGQSSTILEKHADETMSAPDVEDVHLHQEADTYIVDTETIAIVSDISEEENRPIPVVEEMLGSEKLPTSSLEIPETLPEPNANSLTDHSAENSDVLVKSEESSQNDELAHVEMEEPAPEKIVVVENQIVPAAVHEKPVDIAEEPENELVSLPENINFANEESVVSQHDDPGNVLIPMNGFENTRTRSQVTSFAVSEYDSVHAPTIANGSVFRDGTDPVLRTRVQQNVASTIFETSGTFPAGADAGRYNETFKVKNDTHRKQTTMPELPTESTPVFRAKLLQPVVPVVKTVAAISPRENRVKKIKTSGAQKPGSAQKQAIGNTTSHQKKSSDGIAGNKKSVLPKGNDGSFKTGKILPKKSK
ncbi:MAG: hypothetical protein WCP20_01315 [Desulfuromonadales bacterium]